MAFETSSSARSMAVLVSMVLAGCAAAPNADRTLIPSNIQARGWEIFQRDQAAARATDAGYAVGLKQMGVRRWVTSRTGSGWRVRFVAPCGEEICSKLDVDISGDRQKTTMVEPPVRLSANELLSWRSRELARSTEFRTCSYSYNTVVIPPNPADPNFTVYLLAADTDPKQLLILGHHRVTISADAKTILKKEPLSKTCLSVPLSSVPKGAEAAGIYVTHLLDPFPIETHVFTSLTYGMPLYVGTSKGYFAVDGKKIRRIK